MEYQALMKRLEEARKAAHQQGFEKTAEAFEDLSCQLRLDHEAMLDSLVELYATS